MMLSIFLIPKYITPETPTQMSKLLLTNDQWVTEYRARVLAEDTRQLQEVLAQMKKANDLKAENVEPEVQTWFAGHLKKQVDKLSSWTAVPVAK
jgi:hypothetical protein